MQRIIRSCTALMIVICVHGMAGAQTGSSTDQVPFSTALLDPSREADIEIGSVESPSPGKAFMLSLLLPGLGEYYAGNRVMSRVFGLTELTLWSTFFGFRFYGSRMRTDYELYAVAHAGVDPAGKNNDYFVNIENYADLRAFNNAKLQQRQLAAMYPETEEYWWEWDTESSRRHYERMRIGSDRAYDRATIVVAGIVLNHMISGIDAMRVARRAGAETRATVGFFPLREGGLMCACRFTF